MANIDWIKIKNEYINTKISQRKLAEKYDVSINTLTKRAIREKWKNERDKQYSKVTAKVQQKTVEKIASKEVDRLSNVLLLSDKLIPKILKAIEQIESYLVGGEVSDIGMVDVDRLRKIVASVKDLKEIVKENDNENNSENQIADKLIKIFGGDGQC